MTQPSAADPMAAASPRVPCPLRGGASIDLERCLTCAYFRGPSVCGTDPRDLVYAGPNWWRLLIP
jgi:hypothetical protein